MFLVAVYLLLVMLSGLDKLTKSTELLPCQFLYYYRRIHRIESFRITITITIDLLVLIHIFIY